MNEYLKDAIKICEAEKERDSHSVTMIMTLDIAEALQHYHEAELPEDDRGNEP